MPPPPPHSLPCSRPVWSSTTPRHWDRRGQHPPPGQSSSSHNLYTENWTLSTPLPPPQTVNWTLLTPLPPPQTENWTLSTPLPPLQTENWTLSTPLPPPHTENWTLSTPLPPLQTENVPFRRMSVRHRSSNPQPHPAVLPHLRHFETPDMAQSGGCPQEALGTG